MTTLIVARRLVHHSWQTSTTPIPYLQRCRPINLPVPGIVFHRLKAASEILPLHGHDPEFGLIRDFGQSIEDRHLHFVFLLVWLPEGGPMRPSRLVVCSDAVEVLDSEADLRLSHLHCDELIERAARIISGMIARVRGDDTGHELLRAQAALRQAAFKAIGRYRRRG